MDVLADKAVWILIPAVFAIAIASTMGFFGGNKMPVEGKVRIPEPSPTLAAGAD